jgi:S1-C subfamily serine protease/cytochrome c556
LTNAHVVAGASIIKASVPGRSSWISARILGLSPCDDLAVIDLEGSGFTPAILGESDDLKLGQEVVAIGYPLAGDLDTQLTVNQGIVSKLKTQLDQLTHLIQTDTPINPGNSGGPLVNLRGEVVGINTIKVEYTSSGRPVQGINFAIGVSLAKEAIAELERGDNRHWLGLNMVTNDQEVADYFSLPTTEGMLVYAVADGSPAAEVGLATGDILLRLKGVTVQSESDVCDVLRSHRTGDLLPIEIMRGEETLEGAIGSATLIASAQPPSLPSGEGVPSLVLYHNEELGVTFPYPQDWIIDEQDNEVTFESPTGDVSLLFGLYDIQAGTTAEEVMDRTIGDLSEDNPDLEVVATDSWVLSGDLEAVLNGVVLTDDEGEVRWAFFVEMVREATNYTLILTGDETADAEMYGEVLGEIAAGLEVLAPPTLLLPPPSDGEMPFLALYRNEELGVAFPYPQDWIIDEQDNEVAFESPTGDVSLLFGLYDVEAGATAEEVLDRTIGDLGEDYPDLEVVATDSWVLSGDLEAVLNGVVFTDDGGEVRWAFFVEMVREATNYTLILTGDETADAEMYGEVLGEILAVFEVLASLGGPGSDIDDGQPILADDFGDPESGWSTYDDTEAGAKYDDGAFRISVREEQYIAWSSLPQEFDDFALEVSTAWVTGSAINACGVFVRFQDEENLYEFGIDGEGYFMIGKYVDGEWIFLVDWQESIALNGGDDASNDLAVICIENELSFYANGELLATVVDDSFKEGEMALFAETFDEGGVEILFDDLYVWPVP